MEDLELQKKLIKRINKFRKVVDSIGNDHLRKHIDSHATDIYNLLKSNKYKIKE